MPKNLRSITKKGLNTVIIIIGNMFKRTRDNFGDLYSHVIVRLSMAILV